MFRDRITPWVRKRAIDLSFLKQHGNLRYVPPLNFGGILYTFVNRQSGDNEATVRVATHQWKWIGRGIERSVKFEDYI